MTGLMVLGVSGLCMGQRRHRDTVQLRGQTLTNVTVLSEDYREVQLDTDGDGVVDRKVPQNEVRQVVYDDVPAAYRTAMAVFRLGNQYDKALKHFAEAGKTGGVRPWLKDYVAYYSAECVRRQAGTDRALLAQAAQKYQDALASNANSPFREGLQLGLGSILLQQNDLDGARRQFASLERAAVKDEFKLGAMLNLARVDMLREQPAEAVKQFDKVLAKGEKGYSATYAEAVVGKGRALIALKQYPEAGRFLEGALKTTRNDALLSEGYTTLGDCRYEYAGTLKDKKAARSAYKSALMAYLRVEVLYYQDSEMLAKSLYYAGKCFQNLERDDRAQEKFALLRKKFPDSPWTSKIR